MAKEPEGLIGKRAGPLLVIGAGATLGRDLRRVNHIEWTGDKMAINAAGILYPMLFRHWATIHGDCAMFHPHNTCLNHYGAGHKRSMGKVVWRDQIMVHSARMGIKGQSIVNDWMYEWGEEHFPRHWRNGSSGLFAVEIGLLLGYDKIVLAGCPLDHSGYCWDAGDWPVNGLGWTTAVPESTKAIWRERAQVWNGRVASLSGWTRELLGEPTWLPLTPISESTTSPMPAPAPPLVVLSPRMSALRTPTP